MKKDLKKRLQMPVQNNCLIEKRTSVPEDASYLQTKLEALMLYTVRLCLIAYGRITFGLLHDIALSAPRDGNDIKEINGAAFDKAYVAARDKVFQQIDEYDETLTLEEKKAFHYSEHYRYVLFKVVPVAEKLNSLNNFFKREWVMETEQTRFAVDDVLSKFLHALVQEPAFSFFTSYLDLSASLSLEEKFNYELDKVSIYEHLGGGTKGRHGTLSWKDVCAYNTVLPEYRQEAGTLIEKDLGYKPGYPVCLPHEIFIRQAIDQHKRGINSEEEFKHDVHLHSMHIRNDDMKKAGWANSLAYGPEDTDFYNNTLPPYISVARERLAGFLGYYPELRHSLYAEISLRHILADDGFNPSWGPTPVDYRALTAVKYREILLSQGQEAADKSPLIG